MILLRNQLYNYTHYTYPILFSIDQLLYSFNSPIIIKVMTPSYRKIAENTLIPWLGISPMVLRTQVNLQISLKQPSPTSLHKTLSSCHFPSWKEQFSAVVTTHCPRIPMQHGRRVTPPVHSTVEFNSDRHRLAPPRITPSYKEPVHLK